MKHKYLILLLFFSCIAAAQNINFPNAGFKARLVSLTPAMVGAYNAAGNPVAIDTNNDGEIQVSEAHAVYKLVINHSPLDGTTQLTDISGIENFINLKELHCSSNNIATADLTALSNLEILFFQENNCDSLLMHGLSNLQTAYCGINNFTTLDLTGLTALELLQCHQNNLTAIDLTGLVSLTSFDAYDNELLTLNATAVPSLTYLGCGQNNLESLNIAGLTSLTELNCPLNQLTSLNLSGLSNLQTLECYDNLLTEINITGLSNLSILLCDNNPFNALDFSQPNNIGRLSCYSTNLSYLNVSGCHQLYDLECSFNQLTSLDVSANANLNWLNAGNNPLHHINLKNGPEDIQYLYLENTPSLQYVCVDEGEVQQVQSLIDDLDYMPLVSSDCSFDTAFNLVSGTVRYDGNNNGCESTDTMMPLHSFNLSGTNFSFTFSANSNGLYTLPLNNGTYTITPVLANPEYFTVTPASATVALTDDVPQIIADFCVSAIAPFNDLEVSLIPTSPARPGFDATYSLHCKNKGTTTLSGDVTLAFQDNLMDLVEASVTPDISGNLLTWNYSDLAPFEEITIEVTMNINSPVESPAVNIDDQLEFTVAALFEEDITPADNTFGIKQIVVGSYDPNDKTCIEGTTITPEMVGDYVHYVIRFENTGTFYAENIIVVDIIDEEKFDISSIVLLQGSHDYFMRITNGNSVEFVFQNIMLPGMPSDDRHGYVAFRIKTKETLQLDDSFSNTAAIYFDFNAPVITNDAVTTIALPLNNPRFTTGNQVALDPNPATNVLNIRLKDNASVTGVAVYNVMGQLLSAPQQSGKTIDVSGLGAGTYFVKVSTEEGTFSSQFIKP
jgi:hypothetical protein